MLQRPQSLFFLAAATIAFIAAFSPLVTFSPEKNTDYPEMEELNLSIHVNTNGLDYDMNYVSELHGTKKAYERNMDESQKELDREIDESGIGIVFLVGMIGSLLLGIAILLMILLYNNRKLQIRMGLALFLLTLTTTAGIFLGSKFVLELFSSLDIIPRSVVTINWAVSYEFGTFLYPAIATLLLIGILLVRKDDNLVKSLDRLR